jgi:hypothetical protein
MWRSKRSSARASSAGGVEFTTLRKKCCTDEAASEYKTEGKLQNFFRKIGSSIESFIDATPLGVPSPCEPWSPLTDRKKALLSNPISVLKVITETMSAYSPTKFISSLGAVIGEATAQWVQSSAMMLMGLREGLAHAVLGEDENGISDSPVIVESEDVTVRGEVACGNIFDISRVKSSKKGGPETRRGRMVKGLSNFVTNRVIPFIDGLTLLAHGIVVTSDDCSVECSLASLIDVHEFRIGSPSPVPDSISSDKDDFEDCPSVLTEIAVDELEYEDDGEGANENGLKDYQVKGRNPQESKELPVRDRDDIEYVITDVSDTVEEDGFVAVFSS